VQNPGHDRRNLSISSLVEMSLGLSTERENQLA
jgi:hypothetical protein